jgi:hypothetical protein
MDSSSFTELSQRRPVHIPIVLICVNRLLVGGDPRPAHREPWARGRDLHLYGQG